MGTGGHRWVALLGTGRWHFWAQVCGTARWYWWALLGTGVCTAGHRWVHCWAQVGVTGGWHCWVPITVPIPALTTAAENRQLHFPVISMSLDAADHVVKGRS
ncbi:unnamed protein product, partial [Staurois parvus]